MCGVSKPGLAIANLLVHRSPQPLAVEGMIEPQGPGIVRVFDPVHFPGAPHEERGPVMPLGEELSEARGDLRLLGENVMVLAGILREIEKKR
jgi:hypothetical protein